MATPSIKFHHRYCGSGLGAECDCGARTGFDAFKPMSIEPQSLTTQVGGDHYTKLTIQPITYILANNLDFCEGAVVKYVSRWRDKGGVEDLKKARDVLDKYIQHQESKA